MGGKGGGEQVVGYNYYADVHMCLGHGVPDDMNRVYTADDKLMWQGHIVRPGPDTLEIMTHISDTMLSPHVVDSDLPVGTGGYPTTSVVNVDERNTKSLTYMSQYGAVPNEGNPPLNGNIGFLSYFDGSLVEPAGLDLLIEHMISTAGNAIGGEDLARGNSPYAGDFSSGPFINFTHSRAGGSSGSAVFEAAGSYRVTVSTSADASYGNTFLDMDNFYYVGFPERKMRHYVRVTFKDLATSDPEVILAESEIYGSDYKAIRIRCVEETANYYKFSIFGGSFTLEFVSPKIGRPRFYGSYSANAYGYPNSRPMGWGDLISTMDLSSTVIKYPELKWGAYVGRIRVTHKQMVPFNDTLTIPLLKIKKPNLYGGKEREGGVWGSLWAMFGWSDQPVNHHIFPLTGPNIPAYRGLFNLFFQDFCWGMNPYFKPVSVTWTRIRRNSEDQLNWYQDKITWPPGHPAYGDMNPAHIIYECLTDRVWGAAAGNRPLAVPNEAAFMAVADTLYDEGFGLSLFWYQESPIEEFIAEILRHIDAVMYDSPFDGSTVIKLIRGDYVINDLPVLTADDSEVTKFNIGNPANSINQVTVVYNRRSYNPEVSTLRDRESSVTVRGIGAIRDCDNLSQQTNDYPGIPRADLANTVAQRDLAQLIVPPSTVTIVTNRKHYELLPGDVFVLNMPDMGVYSMVCRVGRRTDSPYGNGEITLDCVEDVFARNLTIFDTPPESGWVNDAEVLNNIVVGAAIELPHGIMVRRAGGAHNLTLIDPDAHFVGVSPEEPADGVYLGYNYYQGDVNDFPLESAPDSGNFPDTFVLQREIVDPTMDIFDLVPGAKTEVSSLKSGDILIVGGDVTGTTTVRTDDQEMVSVSEVLGPTTVRVVRGVYDTIPLKTIPQGTILFNALQQELISDVVEGETVKVAMVPYTMRGAFESIDETAYFNLSVLVDGRRDRPYPPARVQLNSSFVVDQVQGTSPNLVFDWRHRNRLTQQDNVVGYFYDTNVAPEDTTTYTLRWRSPEMVTPVEVAGLTGTTYTFTEAYEEANTNYYSQAGQDGYQSNYGAFDPQPIQAPHLEFELFTVRGTLDSYKSVKFTVTRLGYGYNYGNRYGKPKL